MTKYNKEKEKVDATGGGSAITWKYYEWMKTIYGSKDASPVAVISSLGGLFLACDKNYSKLLSLLSKGII